MHPPDTFAVTMPSDREARITRAFNAPRHLVFTAFTTPDLLTRWMLGPLGLAPRRDGYDAVAHPPGTREMVFVLEGEVMVTVDGDDVPLETGDYAVFRAARPHRYTSRSGRAAHFVMVVIEPIVPRPRTARARVPAANGVVASAVGLTRAAVRIRSLPSAACRSSGNTGSPPATSTSSSTMDAADERIVPLLEVDARTMGKARGGAADVAKALLERAWRNDDTLGFCRASGGRTV